MLYMYIQLHDLIIDCVMDCIFLQFHGLPGVLGGNLTEYVKSRHQSLSL